MAKKIGLLKADFCPQAAGKKASGTEEAFRAGQSYPVEGLSRKARVPPLAVRSGGTFHFSGPQTVTHNDATPSYTLANDSQLWGGGMAGIFWLSLSSGSWGTPGQSQHSVHKVCCPTSCWDNPVCAMSSTSSELEAVRGNSLTVLTFKIHLPVATVSF